MRIDVVQVGTPVFAYDFETKRVIEESVLEVHCSFTDCWVEIGCGETSLTATKDHPFWLPDSANWIRAADLAPGAVLLSRTGKRIIVDRLAVHRLATPEVTFNLHVHDANTFFAGPLELLVHNDSTPLDQAGHRNYRLVDANGKTYYHGRFGPNETQADVAYRHANNPKNATARGFRPRFNQLAGDKMVVEPGSRTYAEARRWEHEAVVRDGTLIGRSSGPDAFRGNRDFPMSPRKFGQYYSPNAC